MNRDTSVVGAEVGEDGLHHGDAYDARVMTFAAALMKSSCQIDLSLWDFLIFLLLLAAEGEEEQATASSLLT